MRQLCLLRESLRQSGQGDTLENITTLWGAHEIGQHDQNSYEGMSNNCEIRPGVRQGCLLSPFPFILAIYWIMKT